jgi:hypothetical protein
MYSSTGTRTEITVAEKVLREVLPPAKWIERAEKGVWQVVSINLQNNTGFGPAVGAN